MARHLRHVILWSLLFFPAALAFARQPLTFQERVEAQEAVERVFYAHRIWPKENLLPKPPFERMVPRSVLEAKVTDTLKKCSALEEFWRRPLTGEQLQAEMDRMAKGTQAPATLRELFAALGNDPTLIAECLARPILADRLIRNWFTNDKRFSARGNDGAVKALEAESSMESGVRFDHWWAETSPSLPAAMGENLGSTAFRLPSMGSLEASTCSGGWAPSSLKDAVDARYGHTAVWTGVEMIVWGGLFGQYLGGHSNPNTGGRYNPATDSWQGTSTGSDCPEARWGHSAIWTGTVMVVWGGSCDCGAIAGGAAYEYLQSGGRYDPASDTWSPLSITDAPAGRRQHTAIWTGSQMLVWGGYIYVSDILTCFHTGGRYDPLSDRWSPLSTGAGCPEGRYGHTAVWTGSRMIVWGGTGADWTALDSGGLYDPTADGWAPTSTAAGRPSPRSRHTAVWTGSEMVIWGGADADGCLDTGGSYDPTGNTWVPTPRTSEAPSARGDHTAVWTGTEMIVWGGADSAGTLLGNGARFSPTSNAWASVSGGGGSPDARIRHTAVWTGAEMIVWGGVDDTDSYLGIRSGARFSPASDSWVPTSLGPWTPSIRVSLGSDNNLLWTGAEMLIWGNPGFYGIRFPCPASGGRYSPALDQWSPISTEPGSPAAYSGGAVWTGTEMVYLGTSCDNYLAWMGGRYDPVSDSWSPVSDAGSCPGTRTEFSTVWTGTEMIVWGGIGYDPYSPFLNTGDRYTPTTDTWLSTSVGANCPQPRNLHSAVWSGSAMLVWGGQFGSGGGSGLTSGGQYHPLTDTWTPMSVPASFPGRERQSAIWTGTEMIIWGGGAVSSPYTLFNTGARYNPVSDAWTPTSTAMNCPNGRMFHSAVWTGSEMIVFGGQEAGDHGRISDASGGRYDPASNSWAKTSEGPYRPSSRGIHGAAWNGSAMVVWGGLPLTYSGGIYYPEPLVLGPSEACAGGSAVLSTAAYSSYQWTLDGTDIPGANARSYTATLPGTYGVRGTDANGCTATSPGKTVSFVAPPSPTVSGPTSNACPQTGVTLSADGGPYASYQWARDGVSIGGATAGSYGATLSGSYTVTVADGIGCSGTSAGHSVTVGFCPTTEVSPPEASYPLRLVADTTSHTGLYLYFQKAGGAEGYNLYFGTMGDWYSHGGATGMGRTCDLPATDLGTGEMRAEVALPSGLRYLLVTAYDATDEGPSGFDSSGVEIPKVLSTCGP